MFGTQALKNECFGYVIANKEKRGIVAFCSCSKLLLTPGEYGVKIHDNGFAMLERLVTEARGNAGSICIWFFAFAQGSARSGLDSSS